MKFEPPFMCIDLQSGMLLLLLLLVVVVAVVVVVVVVVVVENSPKMRKIRR